MNKPVYAPEVTTSAGKRMIFPASQLWQLMLKILIQLLLLGFLVTQTKAQCSMYADDLVQVALDGDCQAEITYDIILEDPDNPLVCYPNGPANYTVFVMDRRNQVIPTNPIVTSAYVGQTLKVKVRHSSGNTAWGSIEVVDYMPPLMTCPSTLTLACTEPSDTSRVGRPVVSDCTGYTLTYYDRVQTQNCQDPMRTVTRVWRATDIFGNTRTCEQTIFYTLPELADVVFPPNRDDIYAPAIFCDSFALNSRLTDPVFNGFPSLNGEPIVNGGICNVGHTFSDQKLAVCNGGFKILRSWAVADWCTGGVRRHIQIIAVKDKTPPTITCAPIIYTAITNSTACSGAVVLPPATVSDNCSNMVKVQIQTPFGFVNGNGGTLPNATPGTYTVKYVATDDCGNSSFIFVQLEVRDGAEPVGICRSKTAVGLGLDGTATVPARSFDEGSYDNCCLDRFEIKRMIEPDSHFSPQIRFDCADSGAPVMLILRMWDCNGNYNECMIEANVSEKLAPAITCPRDLALDCFADPTDLALTGQPIATDGCGVDTVFYQDEPFFDHCHTGYIKRTWTVFDLSGNSKQCQQRIGLENRTRITVAFPDDFTSNDCLSANALAPDSLPAQFARPVINGRSCNTVGVNFEDRVFRTNSTACFKIMRAWTVMDWCKFDQTGGADGKWEHTQTLEVFDQEPPLLTCPGDLTIELDGDDCVVKVTLPLPVVQDCNANATITSDGDLGSGFLFDDVLPGVYEQQFKAADGCGNSAVCRMKITVHDAKPPTVKCLGNLAVELPPDGELVFEAQNFDAGSFDNCAESEDLKFRIERIFGTPSSQPPAANSLIINCDDYENSPLSIAFWVGDAAGNWDFCTAQLDVQDNQNACGSSAQHKIALSGAVSSMGGGKLENVEIQIAGAARPFEMTDDHGNFVFSSLPAGRNYSLTPRKNDDLMNGVSTWDLILIQKHLLAMQPFSEAEQFIAADINHDDAVDVLDVLDLRAVLLRARADFPANQSWRFVPAGYEFANPMNPFSDSFPEKLTLTRLESDLYAADFEGIKIGDLDHSAATSNVRPVEERGGKATVVLLSENSRLQAGEEVEIAFRFAENVKIEGCQLTLQFDPETMEYLEVVENERIGKNHFGTGQVEKGLVHMSWTASEEVKWTVDEPFFTIKFRAKRPVFLADALSIADGHLAPEAYFDREKMQIRLLFSTLENTTPFAEITPNPFSDIFHLKIQLAENQEVEWLIFDTSGKLLKTHRQFLPKGISDFSVESADLRSGVYFLKVESEGWNQWVKIVRQ